MSIFSAKATETRTAGASILRNGQGTAAVSIPLYVAAAIVQMAGFAAVAYQMDESSSFSYFTITMSLLGFTVSYFLRRFRVPANTIRIGAIILAILLLVVVRGTSLMGSGVFDIRGVQETLLVSALALTATFCSFLLVTDVAVLFTCVWSIALIGLTGTVNINRELIVCFVVFLTGATFLLVHQSHLITQRGTGEGGRSRGTYLQLLRTQLLVTFACGLAALVGGFLIAIPLQMVGRNMSLTAIIQRLKVPPAAVVRAPTKPRLSFDDQNFMVGLGPVDSDNKEVMRVESKRPFYYRGRIFSRYQGHGWDNPDTLTFVPLEPQSVTTANGTLFRFDMQPSEHSDERKKIERLHFKFTMKQRLPTLIYHAAEPRRVVGPFAGINQRPDNTLSVSNFGMVNIYEVDSDVSVAKQEDLRKSGTDYPADIRRLYLQHPDNPALEKLAAQAVGGIKNPYNKAEAIRDFISKRCAYTLDAPAVPASRDAAEFFLNDSQEGYCDLYATATTILCRIAGLPARVATGFQSGTISADDPNAYSLLTDDRHSWAEVYFVGYGWQVFDATQTTISTDPTPGVPLKKSVKPWWERLLLTDRVPVILTLIGLVVLLLVGVNEMVARLRYGGQPRPNNTNTGMDRRSQIPRLYGRAERSISRRSGIVRTRTMTPGDFNRMVRARYDAAVADALAPLVVLTETALYGLRSVTSEDVAAAQAALESTANALRQVPKKEPKEKRSDARRATP